MNYPAIEAKPYEVLFNHQQTTPVPAQVTIIMTCYKYGREGLEALESLKNQTEAAFNIILIDDHSPDDSVATLLPWFEQHKRHSSFAQLLLIRHLNNQGLSKARNTAISLVNTKYTFVLDADNQLYPRALQRLREAMVNSELPMAYSLIEVFEGESNIMGNSVWLPKRFSYGNYIDAMAMIETSLLHQLGGYRTMPHKFGWEDYDFWCKMVDEGLQGCHVPQLLCRYRVHAQSMLRTTTNAYVTERAKVIKQDFEAHHRFKFYF